MNQFSLPLQGFHQAIHNKDVLTIFFVRPIETKGENKFSVLIGDRVWENNRILPRPVTKHTVSNGKLTQSLMENEVQPVDFRFQTAGMLISMLSQLIIHGRSPPPMPGLQSSWAASTPGNKYGRLGL